GVVGADHRGHRWHDPAIAAAVPAPSPRDVRDPGARGDRDGHRRCATPVRLRGDGRPARGNGPLGDRITRSARRRARARNGGVPGSVSTRDDPATLIDPPYQSILNRVLEVLWANRYR